MAGATSTNSTAQAEQPAAIAQAFNALPTQVLGNPKMAAIGPLALYNGPLINIATCLLMHGVVFGLLLTIRRFDLRKVCDFKYLSFALSLSLVIAAGVFIANTDLGFLKLYFFLEHEALEILIFLVTILPPSYMDANRGKVLMMLWATISLISIIMALQDQHHHAADFAAWGAFCSDSLLAIQGFIVILRWRNGRPQVTWQHAMAGLGHMFHGLTTLAVPPIFAGIIYSKWDPEAFAWAWFVVFMGAFGTIGCAVPLIGVWASELRWNCGGSRKAERPVLPTVAFPLRPLGDRKASFTVESPQSGHSSGPLGSNNANKQAPPAYLTRKSSLQAVVDLPYRQRSDSLATINVNNDAMETMEMHSYWK